MRGFAEHQFGFRAGKSTTDAVRKVVEIAEGEKKKTLKTRNLVVLIMLDVINAFNSASWSTIREAMVSKGICPALITLIEGYLEDRYLEVDGMLRKLTAGVPHGIGPGTALVELTLR